MRWLCGSSFDAKRNSVRLYRHVQSLQSAECKVCRHIFCHLVSGKVATHGRLKRIFLLIFNYVDRYLMGGAILRVRASPSHQFTLQLNEKEKMRYSMAINMGSSQKTDCRVRWAAALVAVMLRVRQYSDDSARIIGEIVA